MTRQEQAAQNWMRDQHRAQMSWCNATVSEPQQREDAAAAEASRQQMMEAPNH